MFLLGGMGGGFLLASGVDPEPGADPSGCLRVGGETGGGGEAVGAAEAADEAEEEGGGPAASDMT